jgi:hypothetical protein
MSFINPRHMAGVKAVYIDQGTLMVVFTIVTEAINESALPFNTV